MRHERRRDRVWKNAIIMAYRYGEVDIKDLDVTVTKKVETKEQANKLIEEEEYRSEEDMTQNPDGSYTVILEPDMSDTGKRSVLKTLSSDRYNFLKKAEDKAGIWEVGPLLQALFGVDDPSAGHELVKISGPAKEQTDLEEKELGTVLQVFNGSTVKNPVE
ncbi:hypothetical protein [Haloarcula sp. Atlit-7R]|uniref:hypothetical protein n=1 Tax=Haloarcula sp. Atlit-7R TaxID=2282125 RepID=UPI000EF14847|nr:hypothetical protein [Haloarcula sp. Atlit-7R]RLM94343.1 hypothetical protein D3D01_15895 [Haloarcula sp. Atlit-7R]